MAPAPSHRREASIDWARGVASLLMIQGHAWHAWVAPAVKLEAPYRFTRLLATLPLPAFLVLAGAAVAYRAGGALRRGESAARLRAALVQRGLQVLGAGYLVQVVYALIDGAQGLDTVLRADVLQVIGLSLVALGLCCGGSSSTITTGSLARRATLSGLLVTGLCPLVAHAWPAPPGVLRPVIGLFIDVPGITRMPFFPLYAWAAFGALAGHALGAADPSRVEAQARRQRLAMTAGLGLGLAVLGDAATDAWLAELGGTLSRGHLAVVPNVFAYAGRGLLVLGLGPLLVEPLAHPARRVLRHFGQASLWAYVFHIPFCYGRLGKPLQGHLTMLEAAPFVLLLAAASYGVVRLRLSGHLRWPRATVRVRP